jgi:DivIVA domain-containing protein
MPGMADFPRAVRGYHRDQVDALVARIEGTLGRSPLYAAPATALEVGGVRFTRRLRGYRMKAVDAALQAYARELERRGGWRRMANPDADRLIGMVRNVQFAATRLSEGYDERQVDGFLDDLIVALRGRRALASDVRAARFGTTRARVGYRQAEVDAFLDHLAAEIERLGRA